MRNIVTLNGPITPLAVLDGARGGPSLFADLPISAPQSAPHQFDQGLDQLIGIASPKTMGP